MVQPCQVKCSQPCQAKSSVRGWREVNQRHTDRLFSFSFFLFLFLDYSSCIQLSIFHFFHSSANFRPVIVIDDDEWDFFFLSISTEVTPQSDPTSGVYEQPTNTHFLLWVVVSSFDDDDEKNIRPTRHMGIREKYPPFPRRGLIYRHSSSSSSSSISSSSFRKESARSFM